MAFQKPLPEWKQPGIRPPESKIKEGYQVLDKPPAAWLNWQMNTTYEALQELQEKAAEKEDVSQALGEARAYTDEKTKNLEAPVKSVNSKTGDVVLTPEDIGAVPKIGNPTISGNLSVTQRVQSAFLQAESAGGLAGIFAANGTVSAPKDVYVEFKTRGVNGPRSGYIGLPNPAAPDDIVLHSDNGGISLHAPNKKVLINGIDVVGELNQVKQSGVDARSKIAGAINAKGVPASANDSFEQLVQKIGKIQTGQLIDVSAYLQIWDVGSKTEVLFKIPSGTKKARYLPFMSSYGELWRSYYDTSDANFDISVRDRTGKRITLLRCDYPSDTVINIYQLDFKISERLIEVHSRMDNQQTLRQETVAIPMDFDIDSELAVWGYVYSSSSKARSTISMKGSLFV
ncbi:hypothetical protein HFN20_18830 [Paenibacillus dendritiformis]|uniref:hypothetical protein n=1 Tax=Paenibacillus dendritiformis TaxID=130049 RepID=UPI00143D29FC|nr:hypothetical protein [Paenibacillus dendritiformis]NKI23257.1 hypothetical protein [Paenibacillus dendritiformis]NRF98022.1 hypothetical protein [Paenibacillus dendritiformis]